MMMVETLTTAQLNASDDYLNNSTDPGFSKRFWIGVWYNQSGNYVWMTSNAPLRVSKNSLQSSLGHCVVRNNSNGGPWQNVFCPTTYAYAFCQQGKKNNYTERIR